jgi:hypothetical protein
MDERTPLIRQNGDAGKKKKKESAKSTPSLVKPLMKAFGAELIAAQLYKVAYDVFTFTSPILLRLVTIVCYLQLLLTQRFTLHILFVLFTSFM